MKKSRIKSLTEREKGEGKLFQCKKKRAEIKRLQYRPVTGFYRGFRLYFKCEK